MILYFPKHNPKLYKKRISWRGLGDVALNIIKSIRRPGELCIFLGLEYILD